MAQWVYWAHTWGDKISSGWYDKLLTSGKIAPKDLQPNIEPFGFYKDAFIELSSCRNGEGPIPFTSIVEYFKIYGGDEEEDFEDFIHIIRAMDGKLLELLSKKNKVEGNKDGIPSTTNNNPSSR